MFLSIFGLGLKNAQYLKEKASSFIVKAVDGGALFSPLMGRVVDKFDATAAYFGPITFYVVILVFALMPFKPTKE